MSDPLQILDVDLTRMGKFFFVSNKLVFFIFIYTMGTKTIISAKINIKHCHRIVQQLTSIMKRFNHIIRLFEAYIYYVYINRLKGINICMCFICLKMKYLDQIRAMLTVPFIQSKSAFASLTVLEAPLLFNLAQRKPFVVILLYTDTIIKNIKYQFKS